MAFIGLGKIDKNLIPIAFGCIFAISFELFFLTDRIEVFNHIVMSNLYSAITKLLSFIPFIILKIRSKKSNIKSSEDIKPDGIEYIYIDTKKEMIRYKYLYIFLSSLLNFFSVSIQIKTAGVLKVNSWIYDIIFYSIFYYLIFKIKLYKHHYLCIIIIIIVGFILDLSYKKQFCFILVEIMKRNIIFITRSY